MLTSNHPPDKGERIQIRIDSVTYNILKKAASFSHASLSAFVKEASLVTAKEVIKEYENLSLSYKDWELFLGALENPPTPNSKLQAALKKYKDSTSNA